MPLPEDEASWDKLDVMFATKSGGVRRNKLTDFRRVNRNGKIAMKLEDEADAIVDVQLCAPEDDVLLTTALGQCIRFSVDDVRVFTGRTSTGCSRHPSGRGRLVDCDERARADRRDASGGARLSEASERDAARRGRGSHRRGR
jgi:DNA gyrase subunit A